MNPAVSVIFHRPRARSRLAFGAFLGISAAGAALAQPLQRPTPASVASDSITVIGPQQSALPHIFGTVAVPFGTTPLSARWTRVASATLRGSTLNRLSESARGLSSAQQVAFVQAAVNRTVRNRSGSRCSADDGYWAGANETLVRGVGDCIDIAVAKMEALRQLGFTVRDLYLVTGRNHGGPIEAALLVRSNGQFWLLTAHANGILNAAQMAVFTPLVTYGVGMTWAHGVAVRAPRIIARPSAPVQTAQRSATSTPRSGGLDASTVRAIMSARD